MPSVSMNSPHAAFFKAFHSPGNFGSMYGLQSKKLRRSLHKDFAKK